MSLFKEGDYVLYATKHKTEKGRVKSSNDHYVFVVFHCGEEWDNYKDYTGAACKPEHLVQLSKEQFNHMLKNRDEEDLNGSSYTLRINKD
jgi:hypothetical protein